MCINKGIFLWVVLFCFDKPNERTLCQCLYIYEKKDIARCCIIILVNGHIGI